MTPYYEHAGITIYLGDCVEIMPTLQAASVDLVLTDIPYAEVNQKSAGLRLLDRGIGRGCAGVWFRLAGCEVTFQMAGEVVDDQHPLIDQLFQIRLKIAVFVGRKVLPEPIAVSQVHMEIMQSENILLGVTQAFVCGL